MHRYNLKIITQVTLAVVLWFAHVTVSIVLILGATGVIHGVFDFEPSNLIVLLCGWAVAVIMSAYRTLEDYITHALKSVEEDLAAEVAEEEARAKRLNRGLEAVREMNDTNNLNVER